MGLFGGDEPPEPWMPLPPLTKGGGDDESPRFRSEKGRVWVGLEVESPRGEAGGDAPAGGVVLDVKSGDVGSEVGVE